MLFAGLLTIFAITGSASAASPQTFGCRASVARTAAPSSVTVEPFVANPSGTPCAPDTAGVTTGTVLNLGALAGPLGGGLAIGPAEAVTSSTSTSGERNASSIVSVDAASVPTAAGAISIVAPAQASTSYDCVNGAVQATAASTLSAISIGGTHIQLPSVGAPDTLPVDNPLGAQIGTVTLNQNTVTATSDTETLAAIHLSGLADVTIGEATVDQPAAGACNGLTTASTGPTSPGTPGSSTKPTSPMTTAPGAACPVGTSLVPSQGECAIMNAAGKPSITVSPVNSGDIVGGRVMSLTQARAKYRSASCLRGGGPAFVVVGTRGKNHITVKNLRDRVLGLGGNDTVTVKSGKGTCVDGGGGNDRLVNKGKNMVSLYGAVGKDTIVLGNGPAFVKGGAGADHITAGNGKVTVWGGVGSDVIKVGTGHDTVIGGAGNNRITARGKFAHVSAGKGKSIATVRKANRAYAHKHGVKKVKVLA
jgi:Ca2+-binding RTX toxin-like protein